MVQLKKQQDSNTYYLCTIRQVVVLSLSVVSLLTLVIQQSMLHNTSSCTFWTSRQWTHQCRQPNNRMVDRKHISTSS